MSDVGYRGGREQIIERGRALLHFSGSKYTTHAVYDLTPRAMVTLAGTIDSTVHRPLYALSMLARVMIKLGACPQQYGN